MSLLLNPRLFNYLLIVLYVLAGVRWACAGNWLQVIYWTGCTIIMVPLTWGMK